MIPTRTSRSDSPEAIYPSRTERQSCTETAFTRDTSPETAVSTPAPSATREQRREAVLDLVSVSSSRSSPQHTLTHSLTPSNNNQPHEEEERATARGRADEHLYDGAVLNGSVGAVVGGILA